VVLSFVLSIFSGEELTDLESVEQEQPASHHPDDQIKQHSSPQENNAPAESNTAPPQPNISPESEVLPIFWYFFFTFLIL
jgi:hypothetical protein